MNKDYPNCDKCKYMVEYWSNGETIKFCYVSRLIFNSKDLLLLESNVGCEMFEDIEENVLGVIENEN